MKNYKFLFIILFSCITSCAYKEPILYQFETYDFNWLNRTEDTIGKKLLTKRRFKYDKINDTLFAVIDIIDSIQRWDSIHYSYNRDTSLFYPEHLPEIKNGWALLDSMFSSLTTEVFYDTAINKKTKLIYLHPYENDTLSYVCKRKYNNLNVYSFRCSSCRIKDTGYVLYLCDSIGIVAVYVGPWNMLSILKEIQNSDKLNDKLQYIRNELMEDSLFFPSPTEPLASDSILYIPPIIVE